MSMIRCPDCGHEISGKASFCPHCGCPTEKTPVNIVPGTTGDKPTLSRFLYFMAVLIFIGGLIISICGSCTQELVNGKYSYYYKTSFSWGSFFIQFPTFVIEGLLTIAVAKLVDEIHATYEMVSGIHSSAAGSTASKKQSDWDSLFTEIKSIINGRNTSDPDLLSDMTVLHSLRNNSESELSQDLYDLFIGLCTDLGMTKDDAAVLWDSLADYAKQKGINAGSLLELCSMLLIRTEAGDSGKQWLYDIADDFVQGTVNDCFCTDDLFRLLTGALVSMGVNNSKSAGAALRALWKAFED